MHLGVLGLDKDSFAADDVVTAGLSNVNVAMAGCLEPLQGCERALRAAAAVEQGCGCLPAARFRMLMDPGTLRDGFKPTGKRYTLAARVTGIVHTAFPGRTTRRRDAAPGQLDLKAS